MILLTNERFNVLAHLAVIYSYEEERTIGRYLAEQNMDQSWLGYHCQFQRDDWTTVFDQPYYDTYINWNPGEPNNGDGGNENCVTYEKMPEKSGMNDLKCNERRKFICRKYN